MPKNEVDQLLRAVQTISESYNKVAEATGEHFNLFSVLQIENDEVRTHSRFIAELLDPNGKHGQGTVFLRKFLDQIGIQDFQASGAKVYTESFVANPDSEDFNDGRIDILIEAGGGKPINEIVIENKIHSGLGEDQLRKYKAAYPDSNLLYLTLHGDEPDLEFNYQSINYETDILQWLETCKREAVDIPVLRESLTNYINLVKKLTNQNIKQQMSKDVVNRVLEDENSLEAYKTLVQAKTEVTETIIEEDITPIINQIAEKYNLTVPDKLHSFNTNKIYSGFFLHNNDLETLNLRIGFEFQSKNREGLIFGFKYLSIEVKEQYTYDSIKKIFKDTFGGKRETDGWPCFKFYSEFENLSNVNTLKKVRFSNEFKEDFEAKISSMLGIVKQNLP
jgi:hypothetical protein